VVETKQVLSCLQLATAYLGLEEAEEAEEEVSRNRKLKAQRSLILVVECKVAPRRVTLPTRSHQ